MTVEPHKRSAPTRRDGVVREIRRMIVLGELSPGEKLREVRLSGDLGVSRATLREALTLLVQDGLLVQEPYRGLSVASLTPQAVRDIALTRMPLDLLAIQAIIDDPTGARLAVVHGAWLAFEGAALDPDPLTQHEAHIDFHRALWMASENFMLAGLWPVSEALTTIVLAQDQAQRQDPLRAHAVHRDLMEAIASADMASVEAALRRHTLDSAETFLTQRA